MGGGGASEMSIDRVAPAVNENGTSAITAKPANDSGEGVDIWIGGVVRGADCTTQPQVWWL
jgi:hypothetical protein